VTVHPELKMDAGSMCTFSKHTACIHYLKGPNINFMNCHPKALSHAQVFLLREDKSPGCQE